jgi:uncharacterized membrane protein YkoI
MGTLALALVLSGEGAWAKDGDDDGGGGSSGSGSSGSGSSSSGSGSGDDDDDDDDDEDEDDSSGKGSGKGSGKKESGKTRDEIAAAVARGEMAPVLTVIKVALKHTPGKVLDVKLRKRLFSYVYRVKILANTGRKRELQIDAKSLKILKVS